MSDSSLFFGGDDADRIPGSHPSVLLAPDRVSHRYSYIRPRLTEDNRIVWQGCETYEDAVAGRWVDIEPPA